MLNMFFAKKKYTILALIFIVFGIFIAAGWLTFRRNANLNWRGIIPGQTTETEVVALLGEPDNILRCKKWGKDLENPYEYALGYVIKPCLFAPLTYEYQQRRSPDKAPATHQIHFRNGRVWLIIEDMFAYPFDEIISNEEVIRKYGWPTEEGWDNYGRRKLIYCEQGVIVGINDIKAEQIFYFEPMSFLECYDEFQFYLTYDPPGMIIN